MATAAELNVKIGADLSAFKAGMVQLEGQLKNVGASLKNVGRQMSLAVTVPIAGVGAAAVKAASDVEEMESKFNTVFRNVGSGVKKDIDAFATSVGRSRFELRGMAAQLGDIFKPLGFTEEAAGDLSVQMAKLAVDLGSFNNMPMDEALRRLQGTLVGSHENALRFGVVINENVLKQELAAMGADKLTGSQKEQAKVQARLNLLMRGTTDAQGDALRTSGSFANQMAALRNATFDLGVTIGRILLPYASDLVERLRDMVGFVQNLNPGMQRLAVIVAGVAAAAGPLVFALGGISSAFGSILGVLLKTMGLFNPWVAGIAAAAAIGVTLYRNWSDVEALFDTVASAIAEKLGPALTAFGEKAKAWADDVVDLGAALYGSIVTWWEDNGAALIAQVGDALTAVAGAAGVALIAFGEIIDLGLNRAKEFWAVWGSDVIEGIGFMFTQLFVTVETQMNSFAAFIGAGLAASKGDWKTFRDELQNIADAQFGGLVTSAENFKAAFMSGVTSEADEFLTHFDVAGFADLIEMALTGTETDWKKFRQKAETELSLDAEQMGTFFQVESFREIVADALASSETNLSDFRTNAILNLQAGGDELDREFGATDFKTTLEEILAGLPAKFDTFKGLALGHMSAFGTGVKTVTDGAGNKFGDLEDDVDNAGGSVAGLGQHIGGLALINPDVSVITGAINDIATEADDAKKSFWGMVPELRVPEGYADFVEDFTPTADENMRWSEFVVNMANLNHHAGEAQAGAMQMARDFDDVGAALDVLGLPDSFVGRVADVGRDVAAIFGGLEAVSNLLNAQTWIDAWNNLADLTRGLVGIFGDVLGLIGKIIVKLGEWALAQIGVNTATGATGLGGATGAGGANTGAAAGGLGGLLAGSLAGYALGVGLMEFFGPDNHQSLLEQGLSEAQIATAIDLGTLLQGDVNTGGLTFGGNWLPGLDLSQYGRMGGGSQTVNVILDGQTIATATVPYLADELEVRGTNY